MLLVDIVTLWAAFLLVWALVNRGVPIFQELVRDMTDFFMEKALGPGADLFEGREGSGTVAWMMHGMLWTSIGATFTFIGMWMVHEPDAIASLSSIGYAPSVATVQAAASGAATGGIFMLLIGAGLHINGRLSGSGLASDTNAVLVSYAFSMGLFLGFLGEHFSGKWGDYLTTAAATISVLVTIAVLANHLLTIGRRTNHTIMPSQWLIVGGLGMPLVMCVACYIVGINEALSESLVVLPMLASALAVALYVVPYEAGAPLWSRSLAGVTILMTFMTLSPIGVEGSSAVSIDEAAMLTIFYAASMIPILATAGNVFQTARSNWGQASSSAASTSVLLGMFMLAGSAIGHLFVGADAQSAGEIQHLASSMDTLFLWGGMGMIAWGGVISCFPHASGRSLHSDETNRMTTWMVSGGAVLAFLFSMGASMVSSAYDAAAVANDSIDADLIDMSATGTLDTLASIAFYAVAIAAILMMLNMIRGSFSGTPIGSGEPASPSANRIALTPGSTTIRQLLAAGAGVDTEIDVICDTCDEEE
ncbi:MAG TPA: hypothetical protein QF514_03495 [Candidatus Thalassarchaeaceae archaeon]|nr:hypothetical protein [Candidatus Thalassarchaeaceae archaeon]MDP6845138.1 hypothetical protein [Candidatus Thalassarchaeaceae archaeon]HJM41271.1 hypothetical protein [Candidatus Thalassarchaeaceae archaeon]